MLEYSWKILHLCDIPEIPEGMPLYLTWQHRKDGPFRDTQTVECRRTDLDEMVRVAEDEGCFILWMPAYTVPAPPKHYRILHPYVCLREKPCEFYDDGYCFHGTEGCPDRMPYPEVSVEEER